MASRNRLEREAEPVLPASRQPMPNSEQFTRPDGVADTGVRPSDGDGHPRRSAVEIEAELAATTERLAANVDALADRLHPKQVARRSVSNAKSLVTTPDGRPRAEVVGAAAGALVGVAVLVWLARRRR